VEPGYYFAASDGGDKWETGTVLNAQKRKNAASGDQIIEKASPHAYRGGRTFPRELFIGKRSDYILIVTGFQRTWVQIDAADREGEEKREEHDHTKAEPTNCRQTNDWD